MNIDYARLQMVNQQVRGWNVYDVDVLEMLKSLPREDFVPHGYESLAFADAAIPLGHGERRRSKGASCRHWGSAAASVCSRSAPVADS